MSLYISSLNTGSNGNCFYIGTEDDAILIDAGISCREIERRMRRLQLDIGKLRGIIVSHEHSDHISGIPVFAKRYQLPVYITDSTFAGSNMPLEASMLRGFHPSRPIIIGNMLIKAFTKSHDASDPHSFVVSCNDVHVGVFTDIGYPCEQVINYFKQCHAIFLESNYCEDMLQQGSYPYHLKRRISGNQGHLSNKQALDLFRQHRGTQLSRLILSHLSANNNTPEIVDQLFRPHMGPVKMTVASRYEESQVYFIDGIATGLPPERPAGMRRPAYERPQQLSLF